MIRSIFKILFGILIVIVLFLFWAIRGVDYTPYFETAYYQSTKNRLDSLTQLITPESGKVFVGFGRQSITPILNGDQDDPTTGEFVSLPLSGYGGRRGAPATGIHDSLLIKTTAIRVNNKTFVLVASDLLIMPPDVSKRSDELVKATTGLDRNSIFYSATHTHSSVGAWSGGVVGESFNGPFNPVVVEWLASQVANSIVEAIEDLKPGKIGSGNFHAPGFVRNRLVGEDGAVDDDFILIRAEQDSGRKAILGSFNAHATSLGDWNLETSGDFPGYWQRKLEANGFDMAGFFAGSVGSHTYVSEGEQFEKSRYIGEALADSVIQYAGTIELKDTISINSITLEVELPYFQIRISDGLRLNTWLAKKFFPDVGDVYLQSIRLDDLILSTTPSDFSGETALVYKNAMHKKGFRALVTSFNGAYTGYIIPCKYYHLNEYESRIMNWFGPGYNPYINYMLGEMIEEVSSRP